MKKKDLEVLPPSTDPKRDGKSVDEMADAYAMERFDHGSDDYHDDIRAFKAGYAASKDKDAENVAEIERRLPAYLHDIVRADNDSLRALLTQSLDREKVLLGALEFYADECSWWTSNRGYKESMVSQDVELTSAGKRARSALAKHREMKGEQK